jgi:hypothetical protein
LLGLPFFIALLLDDYAHGCSLFTELSACTCPILTGCTMLLDYIKTCGITSKLSGYVIHSKCFTTTKPTRRFWQIQAAIVKELRLVRSLSLVVAFVHPNHNSRTVSHQFITWIKSDG